MIQTASHWLMTLFTLTLSFNIFVHDTNLDTATQQLVAKRNSQDVQTAGPVVHLHTHAEGSSLKTADPREKKKRSPTKNHQHLRKKRTQRPTAPLHTAMAY